MCLMCEGYTEEEMLAHWSDIIRDDGAVILSVDSEISWSYTVGLRWNFDHPELIAAHPDGSKAADAITHALDDIVAGGRLRVGDVHHAPCGGSSVVRPVHHANAAGEWFHRWRGLAHRSGARKTSLRASQLVLQCGCPDCVAQPLLQRPQACR